MGIHIFIDKLKPKSSVFIEGDDFHHLIHTLRYRVGDKVTVVDEHSLTYADGGIVDIQKKGCHLSISDIIPVSDEGKPSLILFQSLVKKQAMENILQKATELGVSEIQPVMTEYSTLSLERINWDRWHKIIREAAMQSRRYRVPKLHKPVPIKNVDDILQSEKVIALSPKGSNGTFKSWLSGAKKPPDSIGLFIGPEGGFSINDIEILKSKGVPVLSFGSSILRAHTAVLSVLSVIRWYFDQ